MRAVEFLGIQIGRREKRASSVSNFITISDVVPSVARNCIYSPKTFFLVNKMQYNFSFQIGKTFCFTIPVLYSCKSWL